MKASSPGAGSAAATPGTPVAAPAAAAPAKTSAKPALSVPPPAAKSPAAAAVPAARPSPVLSVPAPAAAGVGSDVVYRLKPGDPVVVYLRGVPGVPGGEQQIQDIVDENGNITLPYINDVRAGDRTATELEQSVRKAYLDQQIYKYITVNVVVPSQSYYVRGEVRQPGRFALVGEVTLVQAIAAAGGFTEFANPANVEILRGNDRIRVNVREMEIRPERDKPLQAGDVIIVNRSFL